MNAFLAELRRRHVFRVAGGYAVVGWVIAQIAIALETALGLPGWFDRVVVVALLLGFPVALVLAWAFELTPEGVKRTARGEAGDGEVRSFGLPDAAIVAALLLVAVLAVVRPAVFGGSPAQTAASASEAPAVLPNSVAVLPFRSLSPDPANDVYAEGVHIELLSLLHQVRDMNAIARESVMAYRDSDLSTAEIAGALRVQTVMRGDVRYADDRVRVSAELIDPATNVALWSGAFNGELSDVFAFQSEIAARLADVLKAELSPAERERLARPRTDSTEAYELYVRARLLVPNLSPVDGPEVVTEFHDLLDQALLADPEFALAHAAKAFMHAMSMIRAELPAGFTPADAERLAVLHAESALRIDPGTGMAHGALALVRQFNWDRDGALAEWERAVELSPNDADVLSDYGLFLLSINETSEAQGVLDRARALNPSDSATWQIALLASGDIDGVAASSADPAANLFVALGQIIRGDRERAAAELRSQARGVLAVDMGPGISTAMVGYTAGRAGAADEAQAIRDMFEREGGTRRVGELSWMLVHLSVGEREAALDRLRAAAAPTHRYDNGDALFWMIRDNIYRDPVLDEPEFAALRAQLGYR